jgi:hypothetical protein
MVEREMHIPSLLGQLCSDKPVEVNVNITQQDHSLYAL